MQKESVLSFVKGAPSYVKARVFLLALSASVVLIVTTLTIAWIWKLHRGPSLTEQVLEHSRQSASVEAPAFSLSYEIKDMSMALMNKKGTRTAYAQFTLLFDCSNEECKHMLELHRAKIINGIFEVGGEFYTDDFSAPLAKEGFEKFKGGIRSKLSEYFHSQAPREVVIKDWVMN